MKRSNNLSELDKILYWDFIVIGGGASGLGTALDATTRGFKTLLLESHDFSKGTSSRSTKLVHGGVRYLAQGDVSLVREALKERGLLAKNAGHLVKNQIFVIPNYTWWGGYFYRIGLAFYDILAGKLSLGKIRYINKKKTIESLPTIVPQKLQSGVVYHDGQFDDARLSINLAQTIDEKGGTILNYAKVTNLLKNAEGKVDGVVMKDCLNGKQYEIKGKIVINATGVFSNDILAMNKPDSKKFIVPSQGIHLVLDRSFLPTNDALMIPKTSDGRVLFAVPWHNRVVVGTTDTLVEEPSYEPKALEKEIEFILETAQRFLVKKPQREDVLSVFAGLRPLAAPKKEGKSTKEVSRSHKIITSDTGLITITGGKWTTFRKMAEDTINKALKVHNIKYIPCKTENLSIHGNMPQKNVDLNNYLYMYGTDMAAIKNIEQEKEQYAKKIHPQYPNTYAEIVWAIREEMAQTVEDILARRVRFLFLDARAAIDSARAVAEFMAQELNYDDKWVQQQTNEFISTAKNYLLVDYNA